MNDTDVAKSKHEEVPEKGPRPLPEVLFWRGVRLRCPRCGEGRLYRNYIKMNDCCSSCSLKLKREPGYYLGATYFNYGATVLSMSAMFLFFRLGMNISVDTILWPLFTFCLIFPLLFFRHARALWLAFDCQFDRSVLDEK